jgi:hypothetical protein
MCNSSSKLSLISGFTTFTLESKHQDWDSWGALEGHFTVAAQVANASLIGATGLSGRSWPDLDMLPLGVITHQVFFFPYTA